MIAFDAHSHIDKLAMVCSTLGAALERRDMRERPGDEATALVQRGEGEAWRAPDPFIDQHGGAATTVGDKLRAAAERRHERRLGRREWNVVVSPCERAHDAQRPDEANRHLHRANEVLDVPAIALGLRQRDGIGQRQACLCARAQELPATIEISGADMRAAAHARGWARRRAGNFAWLVRGPSAIGGMRCLGGHARPRGTR